MLGNRTYTNMDPIAFFTHCYDLRGDLVHGADPRPPRTTSTSPLRTLKCS